LFYECTESILPRKDLGVKYLGEEMKIGGATFNHSRSFYFVSASKKILYGANLAEQVFDQCVMGQDQLLGMRMELALEGDKVDKTILIPGGRHFHFIHFPTLIQSGKQEHVTIGEVSGATWFLEGIPDIFHFYHCCVYHHPDLSMGRILIRYYDNPALLLSL
jgi:hypothetical protein